METPEFGIGDQVLSAWQGGAELFPATVQAVNEDGTYFLTFNDDGLEEPRAFPAHIRGMPGPHAQEAASSGTPGEAELLDDRLRDAPQNMEGRQRQEQMWADTNVDARAHHSVREQVHKYAYNLKDAIRKYHVVTTLCQGLKQKQSVLNIIDAEMLEHTVEHMFPGQGKVVHAVQDHPQRRQLQHAARSAPFRICLRKRPLLSFEMKAGEYDVVDTHPVASKAICHDAKLSRSGRRLTMTHREFTFDKIWDEHSTNKQVYQEAVQPLVHRAIAGHDGTLVCYGQTGTGKTYTLMGMLRETAADLQGRECHVTFYEVHGKKCYDLLSDRAIVHLRADENERVHIRGAREVVVQVTEPEVLMRVLERGLALRSVEVTERNPISSRSHAVCLLRLPPPSPATASPEVGAGEMAVEAAPTKAEAGSCVGGGRLMLLDLAGSERNYETLKMSAAQHKESGDINSSLMALKDCFRAFHATLLQKQQQMSAAEAAEAPGVAKGGTHPFANHLAPGATPAAPSGAAPNAPANLAPGQAPGQAQPLQLYRSGATVVRAKAGAQIRVPFRSSRLTQVLRECFTNPKHHTVVIASASPTPTDMQHTRNSLDHVALMAPPLAQLQTSVEVEVPMYTDSVEFGVPVHEWTPAQVHEWLMVVEGGRFGHIVLPPTMDGAGLLQLGVMRLGALFSGDLREGRGAQEGQAWAIDADTQRDIGRSLFDALRKEQLRHAPNSFGNGQHDPYHIRQVSQYNSGAAH